MFLSNLLLQCARLLQLPQIAVREPLRRVLLEMSVYHTLLPDRVANVLLSIPLELVGFDQDPVGVFWARATIRWIKNNSFRIRTATAARAEMARDSSHGVAGE
jgi:hypothetical protein